MKETPAAQEAFEDYYGLGAERSLTKLAESYQTSTEPIPTEHIATLKKWSVEHNWQERVKERVRERAAGIRDKLEERAGQMRESVGGFLLVEISRLLEKLKADETAIVLAETVSDLEKEVKLFFQLAEQPLADRIEHGGKIGVELSGDINIESEEARGLAAEFADRLAEIVAGKPGSHAD